MDLKLSFKLKDMKIEAFGFGMFFSTPNPDPINNYEIETIRTPALW